MCGREKVIYSLGTGARGLQEFISLLRRSGIETAVDVRSFPGSRRFPHFGREELRRSLRDAGIGYVWLGDRLGGFREGGYAEHMRTPEFREGLEALRELAEAGPTAFFCAERDPARCHRRFIAGRLQELGWRVVHLEEEGGSAPTGQAPLFP
jgi:uncharacterized protein (DUF488 family)